MDEDCEEGRGLIMSWLVMLLSHLNEVVCSSPRVVTYSPVAEGPEQTILLLWVMYSTYGRTWFDGK